MSNLREKKSIPIGLMCSTTGPYQSIGTAMLCGALLGIQRVSEDVRFGFSLDPHIVNPAGDLAQYYALSQGLLDSGIKHVVGCYTSSSRKEVLPLFERRDGLLWYPSHYEGFECSDNVIYVGASPNQHIIPLISYLMNAVGKRAYCVGSNYVWPWESNRVMREILEVNAGDVLCERYLPIGSTDVEQVIQEIERLKPDFVFSSLIGESGRALASAYGQALNSGRIPRSVPLASCTLSEEELKAVDEECRAGHICSSVYFQSIQSAENSQFVDEIKERFGSEIVTSADAEASFIAVLLLAEAIHRAGSDDVHEVKIALAECCLDAPQGRVWIDPDNYHCYLTPRLGISNSQGDFEVLATANEPQKPDPYLTWVDMRKVTDGGWMGGQGSRLNPGLRIIK
ncbi:transporter substrate-binding domain-containing protein [Pseudomonas sp. Pseu.R1]|uniref:transporter substrate-binding domain-containing protein n=1 Tax=Pseudomonas sp. Pseu.R1 TaxID=3379818 RepID=UPI003B939A0B